ncbi:hypothetical protein [Actinomadura sp. 7K507]|uniref:hypothetical protein n=1 Tax=Actinomadura sp. 7K507 TaxID=2530365 RepID=UPI001A9EC3E4|nr:hypothetical protein [Actinomadura sp. 7K507]
MDEPLSTKPGRPALYRIADSNLRLYLAALRTAHEQTRRGRSEAGFRLIERRWASWRGRAVEPLVRQALELSDLPWPDVGAVGGWWNRRFDPEIDLIGADRAPVAGRIRFAGSIKWLNSPFDDRDLTGLRGSVTAVPGLDPAQTALVAVSLSGVRTTGGVDLVWTPDDVLAAWP